MTATVARQPLDSCAPDPRMTACARPRISASFFQALASYCQKKPGDSLQELVEKRTSPLQGRVTSLPESFSQQQLRSLFAAICQFNRQAERLTPLDLPKEVAPKALPASGESSESFSKEQLRSLYPSIEAPSSTETPKKIKTPPPLLRPPTVGMDKLGFLVYHNSLQSNYFDSKMAEEGYKTSEAMRGKLHRERMTHLQEKLKAHKETNHWGVAVSVFSWVTSLTSIVTGLALIASGVGAIAGAFLLGAGVMTLGSQILEITGGWQRIAKLLPDDSPERKAAVLSWIQIGIVILSVIMGGVGAVLGGFSLVSEGMQFANALFGGFVLIGLGVTQIGKGIKERELKHRQADVRDDDRRLTELEHRMDDDHERLKTQFERHRRNSDFLSLLFKQQEQQRQAIRGNL